MAKDVPEGDPKDIWDWRSWHRGPPEDCQSEYQFSKWLIQDREGKNE
jgi:hypothetical protein